MRAVLAVARVRVAATNAVGAAAVGAHRAARRIAAREPIRDKARAVDGGLVGALEDELFDVTSA